MGNFMKPFDIPSKGASDESHMQWRDRTFTRNPTRRFRYTMDIKKRKESMSAPKKFRTGIIAAKAAFKFIEGGRKEALLKAGQQGFRTYAQELTSLNEKIEVYNDLGRLNGIAEKLQVPSFDGGIKGSSDDLSKRQEIFGTNTYTEKSPKGFFVYVWEALQDLTLMILVVCAILSLAIGISTEGLSEGWHDGMGILMSILIVVLVTATSDYRQSLQFRDLEKERKRFLFKSLAMGVARRSPLLI